MTEDQTQDSELSGPDIESAQEALAFMRSLTQSAERHSMAIGVSIFSAGLVYGGQTLVQWANSTGLIALPGPYHLTFAIGCSVLYALILAAIFYANRKHKAPASVASRAFEAAFAAAGLANLAIVSVFIAVSIRLGDAEVWYLYTPIVFAFQGAAWFIAARLRQKGWLGLVALGWWISAAGLGLTTSTPTYILIASLSLFLLLALPGWVIMRMAARSETV